MGRGAVRTIAQVCGADFGVEIAERNVMGVRVPVIETDAVCRTVAERGYGFGDTSAASENVLFWDGHIHKLDRVEFQIPPDSFLKPWKFVSNDHRFEMDFEPTLDRHSRTDAGILKTIQHQVFGTFSK